MSCDSGKKLCGWITALSQLTVAACVLYVGFLANIHMERMVHSWEVTAEAVHKMQQDVARIEGDMKVMNQGVYSINGNVGAVQNRMSPMGMMRGFMPW